MLIRKINTLFKKVSYWFSTDNLESSTDKQTSDHFIIRGQPDINYCLGLLKKKRTAIELSLAGEKNVLKTFVLETFPSINEIIVDCSIDEDINNAVVSANKVTFFSMHDGIECSFEVDEVKAMVFHSEPALCFKFPKAMHWIQRRLLLRTIIPELHKGSICEIRVPRMHGKLIKAKLYDLSSSGFSFLNADYEFKNSFLAGDLLSGLIYLHKGPYSCIQFKIKHIDNIRKANQGLNQMIGCEFVNIPISFESQIQYYIQSIQIKQIVE